MTATLLLAIDTASAAVSVAAHDGVRLVAERASPPSPRHAELLSPMIEDVLAAAGARPTDVTAIGVGTGPGPFTGLRVGLVTARMLGYALGVPVHGVCSLDVVAAGAVRLGVAEKDGDEFVVATDARRREVYWGRYVLAADTLAGWRRTAGPQVALPAAVPREGLPVAGRGALLYPGDLAGPAGEAAPPADPSAADLAALLAAALDAGDPDELLLGPDPTYLRRPDAAPPGARKRVTPS